MKKTTTWIILLFIVGACKNSSETLPVIAKVEVPKKLYTEQHENADTIISEAIEAHGGELYDKADYTFVFRKKEYRFTNNHSNYTYSVKNDEKTCDFIVNGNFERYVNEEPVALSEKRQSKYAEALNSVIYFATLPHKLKDAAVNKKYIQSIDIKGLNYDVIKITFDQEGGGKDHDDEFYYWINKETKKIDFLAYNYKVNGGGVRFRSAYNRRVVAGITFQDYINWKASVGTPLKELPLLYEQGKLKELSRIVTEKVVKK
ncbi:DUF6503 family protein [Aquimarina sp. RZ0]|uniref:DUF6503 family protein n=1 Tax=Aquimarina sp. RZ0 TaxID=2607730 RepID=UPI0011F1826E|nr:DUF6503 family protein [Aquimarina sp. RZ0]KAA1245192.1 hypothetical protein F0000_13150 [Aquimarina sp. RZ0]